MSLGDKRYLGDGRSSGLGSGSGWKEALGSQGLSYVLRGCGSGWVSFVSVDAHNFDLSV